MKYTHNQNITNFQNKTDTFISTAFLPSRQSRTHLTTQENNSHYPAEPVVNHNLTHSFKIPEQKRRDNRTDRNLKYSDAELLAASFQCDTHLKGTILLDLHSIGAISLVFVRYMRKAFGTSLDSADIPDLSLWGRSHSGPARSQGRLLMPSGDRVPMGTDHYVVVLTVNAVHKLLTNLT